MNELISMKYDGSPVRILTIDGDPWWVAKDVCDVLGLTNVGESVAVLDDDEKSKISNSDLGRPGGHDSPIVNEPGLYSLIMRSRKPEAKAFKRWVTHEVLPSVRKTGAYGVPQTFSEALQLAADQARQLEEQRPAVEFYEAVTDSKTALPMAQVAKVLDMGIGRNGLFQFLRDSSVLRQNNEPYQEYIDKGWFRVVEQKYQTSDGETHVTTKTLVYQRGVDAIRRLLYLDGA